MCRRKISVFSWFRKTTFSLSSLRLMPLFLENNAKLEFVRVQYATVKEKNVPIVKEKQTLLVEFYIACYISVALTYFRIDHIYSQWCLSLICLWLIQIKKSGADFIFDVVRTGQLQRSSSQPLRVCHWHDCRQVNPLRINQLMLLIINRNILF